MEKSVSQKKRSDSCNKDDDDGSRKDEQRPKDDFSGQKTADKGSKLKSASEPMNEPKKEKVHKNKKEATDAKQDKIQVEEEHKVKEQMIKEKVKREQEAAKDQKEAQKAKEEHKRREKITKQQKQEKVEKERENKDIKEEEKRKDEEEGEKQHDKEQERKDEKEEDRKEEVTEEKVEEKKEEERKELRDDAPPTLRCHLDDDRKDIIKKHPILVKLLSTPSSPSKNPERIGSLSACATSPKSGIPKPIPLAAARRSVSPQPPKDVCREISPPPRVPTPDSASLPEERNVCVLSPKNNPEDPLPTARIPDSAPAPETCIPSRIAPTRNVVVKGALARARQSRNVRPDSGDPDNMVDPDFDRRDRPPPSERPDPRNASKGPSPKKSKGQPSPKK